MNAERTSFPAPDSSSRFWVRRIVVAFAVVALAALWWRNLRTPGAGFVASVPAGDQEFAWIHAATSTSAWERFVTGVNRVSHDWPELAVDDSQAFPESTTATPELVLSLAGQSQRIRIRWYKLSQGAGARVWTGRLARRDPPPLVVIGGGSSDRAFDLAFAMRTAGPANATVAWTEPPLLFLTTATAQTKLAPDLNDVELMRVYADRTFRMSFTNAQMAQAVIDFVWSRADLRPCGDPTPALGALGIAALAPWNVAPALAHWSETCAPSVFALEWDDDPYSLDLSKQFRRVLFESTPSRVHVRALFGIPFSIGGQFSPNAGEAEAVEKMLPALICPPLERQLLVLPTLAAPARRVLRSITGALPLVGRSLVAVTGDSINLNNVYRDADVGWDIRSVPVPLVFFAHQNPVEWDWTAPEEDPKWPARAGAAAPVLPAVGANALAPPTNTDEVLLHRDMIRLLVEAAYGVRPNIPGGLVNNASELGRRLRALDPPVFDAVGDRRGGSGEFVLCLRPQLGGMGAFASAEVADTATLEVWSRKQAGWQPVKCLILNPGRGNRGAP